MHFCSYSSNCFLDLHSRQSRRERGISGGDSDDDDVGMTANENMDGVEGLFVACALLLFVYCRSND